MNRLWLLTVLSLAAAACGEATTSAPAPGDGGLPADSGSGVEPDVGGASQPLFFATMIHLEGQLEIPDEPAYRMLNKRIKSIIDLFAQYGAKITVESERPYAEAAAKWGDDLLSYALSLGQGVGTHCDLNTGIEDEAQLAAGYSQNKSMVDALVGAEQNIGCSGGWSKADWVKAATTAGFKYLDAPVMLSYLAAPQESRPEQYSDEEIISTYYHDPVPVDLQDRIYPRTLKDAQDLEADPDGSLVLISGSLGEISSLHEGRKNCFPKCELTQDDTDAILEQIAEVQSFRDPSKVAVLYIHFPLGTLDLPPDKREENTAIIEEWLATMKGYQESGEIRWQTMREVYEAFSQSAY